MTTQIVPSTRQSITKPSTLRHDLVNLAWIKVTHELHEQAEKKLKAPYRKHNGTDFSEGF